MSDKTIELRGRRERIPLLDAMKGLGICSVLLGHLTHGGATSACHFFYVYHMPLFFFISGVLFFPEKYSSLRMVIKKVAVSLLIPYLYFLLIGVVFHALWGNLQTHLFSIKALYMNFVHCYPPLCSATWFLVSLAMTLLSFWCLSQIVDLKNKVSFMSTLALLLATGFAVSRFVPTSYTMCYVPFKLTTVPIALFFCLIGWKLRQWLLLVTENGKGLFFWFVASVLLFAIMLGTLLLPHTTVSICSANYARFALPPTVLGICLVATCSMLLVKGGGVLGQWMCFVGRNSIVFFAIEGFVTWFVVRGLRFWVDGVALAPYSQPMSIPCVILVFFVVMAVSSIVVIPVKMGLEKVQRVVGRALRMT